MPGLGRPPGEWKGYPLQCYGLENSMDCIVHGVTKSRTRLSDFHFTSLLREEYSIPQNSLLSVLQVPPQVSLCPDNHPMTSFGCLHLSMPMVKYTGKSVEKNSLDVPIFFVSCNEDIISWPFPSPSYPITLFPPPREGGYSSVNTETHICPINTAVVRCSRPRRGRGEGVQPFSLVLVLVLVQCFSSTGVWTSIGTRFNFRRGQPLPCVFNLLWIRKCIKLFSLLCIL